MNTYSSLIVTGSMSWDTIMDFPHTFVDYLHPEKLHQINISFVIDNLEKQMGGTGTNIAYGASQTKNFLCKLKGKSEKLKIKVKSQNLPEIGILGGLGKDGEEHVRFFKKNNISVDGILFDKSKYSANGSVITDTKDNQIWGFYYGACEEGKHTDFKKYVKKDSLMIIAATHPLAFLAAQNYAIKNHIDYMYDAGMSLTWITDRDLKEGVMNTTFLIGNDYEIAMITKRIKKSVQELVKKGINIITTLGEKGVRFEGNSKFQIASIKVKHVIDPTGAGDAWRGGFIVALSLGYDMIDCLKIGNVVASFAIEKYGTVNYKVTKKEFNKRLKSISS